MTFNENSIEEAFGPVRTRVPFLESDLRDFQVLTGLIVPRDYVAFLRVCNGATPHDAYIVNARELNIDFMLGLDKGEQSPLLASLHEFRGETNNHLAYRTLIPIGGEYIGKWVCLAARGPDAGSVWLIKTPYAAPPTTQKLASSFSAFFETLTIAPIPVDVAYETYTSAHVLYKEQRYAEALVEFQRSWALVENAGTAYWIAKSLLKLGQTEGVMHWFSKSVELNPLNTMYSTGYAEYLLDSGDQTQAAEILDRVLARVPTFGPARRLRVKLEMSRG